MKRYGLIGKNIENSLSPYIHNKFFSHFSIDATYSLILEDNVQDAFNATKDSNFDGFNVTYPFKEEIIPFLDELSPEAAEIGAVNTVIKRNNKYIGHNTDAEGFIKALKIYNSGIFDKTVFINSAGGAARAVAYASLKGMCKSLIITGRNALKRYQLYDDMQKIFGNDKIITFEDDFGLVVDIAVNTTPLGSFENKEISINLNEITTKEVFDLAYTNHGDTPLISMAKNLNLPNYDGITILVTQAILSEKIWTNKDVSDLWIKELILNVKNYAK